MEWLAFSTIPHFSDFSLENKAKQGNSWDFGNSHDMVIWLLLTRIDFIKYFVELD